MRILTMLLLATLLTGGKYKLELLPKPEKGKEESIDIEAKIAHPEGDELASKTVKGVLKRKIKSLGEDGLPDKEQLSMESATFEEGHEGPGGGWSSSSNLNGPWTTTVKRDGRGRRATLDLPDNFFPELGLVLKDDPDALIRAILPDEEVEKGDEWEIEPKDLLPFLAPRKAKLGAKSKATASFVSLKDGEATLKLDAVLRYTVKDDDDEKRLTVHFEVHGPIDGSAPPKLQKLTLSWREPDPKNPKKELKQTLVVTLKREWVETEEKDEKDKK